MDDSSDILGGQLNIERHASRYPWSNLSLTNQFLIVGTALVLVLSFRRLYPSYKQYQERRYRKQMRRRHGIPDSDHRPFNVAYAAASKARMDREASVKNRSRLSSLAPQTSSTGAQQHITSSLGQASIRQRSDVTDQRRSQIASLGAIPGGLPRTPSFVDFHTTSGNTTTASEADVHFAGSAFVDRDVVQDKPRTLSSTSLYQPAFTRAAPLTRAESEILGQVAHSRRGFDADIGTTSEKENVRWHTEDDDMADDMDQTAEFDENMDVDQMAPSPLKGKRGAKRVASMGEEGFDSGRNNRDKRARRTRKGADDSVDGDVEAHPRGKKRDRGSSFEAEDSHVEEDGKAHRHRRRRVVSRREASDSSRGRKRGREPESMESDEDSDSPSRRATRHKRGKKTSLRDDESEEGMISNDPLCRGRRIGEEWESNGVHYKVSSSGQRLRQALVKRTRSRFPMPQDSEHPDANVHIDVFVESWLTEEEYQAAKDKQELAWQQSPTRKSSPTEMAPPEVAEIPLKGKNLLWSSTASKDTAPRKGLRQVASSNGSLRVNPFQPMQSGSIRRITALQAASAPEPSQLLRSVRSYSKWEKQDLEAAAMAKLRERVKQDTTAAASAPGKDAPAAGSTAAPTTNASKTSEQLPAPAPAAKATFTFGAPSSAATTKPSLPTLNAPSTEPFKPSTVPFPSGPAPAEPSKPSTASSTPAPAPAFSFAKPAETPAAAGTSTGASTSSSVPNFFAKPASTAAPSSPTPNIFSAPAAAGPEPSKPAFSFPPPPSKTEERPAQAPSTAAPSLLSRLGSFGAPAQSSSTEAAPAATTSVPAFPFGKPEAPAYSSNAAATATSTSSSTAAAPKFSFAVPSKPAESMSAVPTAGVSNPVFSFTAKPNSTTPATTTSEPPKFSFGAPSGSSSGTTTQASTATPSKDSAAAKTAFSFGTTTPAGEPKSAFSFGNTTTPAGAPKPFTFGPTTTPAGEPKTTSVFGGTTTPAGAPKTTSIFGGTTTPAGEPKTTSIFGSTTTPVGEPKISAFGNTSAPAGEPKTTSAFGNTMAPPGESKPASVFGTTTTPAGEPKVTSVFDQNVAPKTSIFGSTTPAGAPKTPAFGNATSAFGSNAAPAGEPKASVFGSTSTAAGASKPSFAFAPSSGSTPIFGQPSTVAGPSTQPVEPAKSSFSFGVSSFPSTSAAPAKTDEQPKAAFSFAFSGQGNTNGTTASPFGFGSSTTPGAANTTIAPGANAFGATSTLGTASAFGNKPTAQTTPNAFGLSAPSPGAFAFGKTNTDSTQK